LKGKIGNRREMKQLWGEMVAYMEDSGGSPNLIRELPRLACPLGSGVTQGSTRGGITGFRKGGKLPESGRGRLIEFL